MKSMPAADSPHRDRSSAAGRGWHGGAGVATWLAGIKKAVAGERYHCLLDPGAEVGFAEALLLTELLR
jgi:hypothetical protein